MPDTAPKLHASPLDLNAPPMAGSSGSGHVEHEKKTFFSLLKNTRSEDGSQGRAALCASRWRERSPLTDTAAKGTRGVSRAGMHFQPRSFDFNTLTPQQPTVTPAATLNSPFSP
jgi:hypothetical protein